MYGCILVCVDWRYKGWAAWRQRKTWRQTLEKDKEEEDEEEEEVDMRCTERSRGGI